VLGNEVAKRLKVRPCLRRSGYAQAGVKVSQHTPLPFGTFFMELVGSDTQEPLDGRSLFLTQENSQNNVGLVMGDDPDPGCHQPDSSLGSGFLVAHDEYS
jgi:hypothetical protein